MDKECLENSNEWRSKNEPIVGYVFDVKGLMAISRSEEPSFQRSIRHHRVFAGEGNSLFVIGLLLIECIIRRWTLDVGRSSGSFSIKLGAFQPGGWADTPGPDLISQESYEQDDMGIPTVTSKKSEISHQGGLTSESRNLNLK